MKILILSVTAGHGHHAAAAALEQEFRTRGHAVKVVDLFRELHEVLYRTIDKGYAAGIKFVPKGWGFLYNSMLEGGKVTRKAVSRFIRGNVLLKELRSLVAEGVDVVVTTHVFASMVTDELVRGLQHPPRHIGVMTDYTLHPFWEEVKTVEKLTVCGDLIVPRCRRRGIPDEKLLPVGIPVEKRFQSGVPKAEACDALGIRADLPTVLLVGGSMGFGDLPAEVARIAGCGRALQILVVCGKNTKQKIFFEQCKFPMPVVPYGFVHNLDLLMDAADFVVTKPGGLTTTEALSKQKPLILIGAIPGQEDENTDYLLNSGMALRATDAMPVHELCVMVLDNSTLLERMRQNVATFFRADASVKLCDYLEGRFEGLI